MAEPTLAGEARPSRADRPRPGPGPIPVNISKSGIKARPFPAREDSSPTHRRPGPARPVRSGPRGSKVAGRRPVRFSEYVHLSRCFSFSSRFGGRNMLVSPRPAASSGSRSPSNWPTRLCLPCPFTSLLLYRWVGAAWVIYSALISECISSRATFLTSRVFFQKSYYY